jgi:hypothetical protein
MLGRHWWAIVQRLDRPGRRFLLVIPGSVWASFMDTDARQWLVDAEERRASSERDPEQRVVVEARRGAERVRPEQLAADDDGRVAIRQRTRISG